MLKTVEEKFIKDVENWLKKLELYWKNKDVNNAVKLFKECKFYQENPFQNPSYTLDEIKKLWKEIENQKDIKLQFKVLNISNSSATVNYSASFIENNKQHTSNGIYYIEFNNNDCIKFMQWFMIKG